MSLALELQGAPVYYIALELAEQYTDDFDVQEQFIEGLLTAWLLVGRDG